MQSRGNTEVDTFAAKSTRQRSNMNIQLQCHLKLQRSLWMPCMRLKRCRLPGSCKEREVSRLWLQYLWHHAIVKTRDHAHDLTNRAHLEDVLQLVLKNAHGEVALLNALHDLLLHLVLWHCILQHDIQAGCMMQGILYPSVACR